MTEKKISPELEKLIRRRAVVRQFEFGFAPMVFNLAPENDSDKTKKETKKEIKP